MNMRSSFLFGGFHYASDVGGDSRPDLRHTHAPLSSHTGHSTRVHASSKLIYNFRRLTKSFIGYILKRYLSRKELVVTMVEVSL